MLGSAKRYIEVIIRGRDNTGPMWKNIRGNIAGLLKDKRAIAAGAAIAALAIVKFVSTLVARYNEAIKKSGEFQKALLEVNTLMNLDQKGVEKLGTQLQALAVKFGQVDDVMARAQYNVVSAGFGDVADSMHILEVASKAAIGGITDVNTAAKVITQTLNAYKLEADQAERVAGTLFATIKGGVTTFEELSGTLGKVTATASVAGLSLEEVSAAMAVLTKNGANSAEAATALNALIIAIGAASGETKVLLDEYNVTLKDGLGGALIAVSEASDGALDKIAELIPNVRAIRAAASAAADGGVAFAAQLEAMADGVENFNDAYAIMSASFEFAVARNEAAHARLADAIGKTGLEGATAIMQGMADGADVQARAVENLAGPWSKITTQWGEAWGELQRVNGELEAFNRRVSGAVTAILLNDWDLLRAAAKSTAEEVAEANDTMISSSNARSAKFQADYAAAVAEQAAEAATGGLDAGREGWGISATDAIFDPKTGKWLDVPKSAEAIAEQITEAYNKAIENVVPDAPTVERDFDPAERAAFVDDEIMLIEDIAALESTRADKANVSWEEEKVRFAERQEMNQAVIEQGDAALERMTSEAEAQAAIGDAVLDVAANFERLASNSLSAMLKSKDGAIMFGRALKGVVLDALSAVIAKLLVIQALKFATGLGVVGPTPYAQGGRIPNAAYGYTVPMSGGRPGMDSQLINAMPGEEVIDRSLSMAMRRFLVAQDNAAAAPATAQGGRGGVSVVLQVARPMGYLDMLDLGDAAVTAALKTAEADL